MGISKPIQQMRVHLQFCKKLIGMKRSSQKDFVYGESAICYCKYVLGKYMFELVGHNCKTMSFLVINFG